MKLKHLSYLLISPLFLTACLLGSDDSSNVSSNQAFLSAFTQMEKVSDRSISLIDQQTEDSSAYSILESGFSSSATSSDTNSSSAHAKPSTLIPTSVTTPVSTSATINNLQNFAHTLINTIDSYIPNSPDNPRQKVGSRAFQKIESEETFISQADVDQFLNELFNPPARDGNTVTYTLRSDTFCQDSINTDCALFLSKLKLQLVIISSNEGEINLLVDSVSLLSIDYSPTYLAMEIFLQGIKQIEVVSSGFSSATDQINLPEIFTGSYKLSIELLSETSTEIVSSLPDGININGEIDGDPITISIANTSNLFSISADSETQSVSLEYGLGTLLAKFTSDSLDYPYNTSNYEVNLAKLTGLLQLNNNSSDNIVATNIGIGDQPFTIDIDNTNAVTFTLDTFGFNIDGTTKAVTLDRALNASFDVSNVNGELGIDTFEFATDPTDTSLTGTLSVTAPANTVLLEMDSLDYLTEITKIQSGGPLHITGTGYFQIDTTVNTGQCLVSGEDNTVFGDATSVTNC